MNGRLSPGTTDVVEAATRVAGAIAARDRGDVEGARELLASFDAQEDLASGAFLVADMALRALSERTGQSVADCVTVLTLRLASIRD